MRALGEQLAGLERVSERAPGNIVVAEEWSHFAGRRGSPCLIGFVGSRLRSIPFRRRDWLAERV